MVYVTSWSYTLYFRYQAVVIPKVVTSMMMWSNGNIFRVTSPLWGKPTRSLVEYTHKGHWRGAWMISLFCSWKKRMITEYTIQTPVHLSGHRAHHDVTVMRHTMACSWGKWEMVCIQYLIYVLSWAPSTNRSAEPASVIRHENDLRSHTLIACNLSTLSNFGSGLMKPPLNVGHE